MANSGYKILTNEDPGPQEKYESDCCQICEEKHSSVSAFCQTCQKCLCVKCVENHKRNSDFAKHLITRSKNTHSSVSKRKTYSNDGYINIVAADDRHTCSATGLVFLSSDQLACADKANKCVKLVDVNKAEIVSKIHLSSGPRDLTVIPPDVLAVTLKDEEMIQVISTKPELSKLRQIKTNGKCRGIAYSEDRFVVTFGSLLFSRIQVLNMKGEVLTTFDFTEKEDYTVYDPRSVEISQDGNHIYVTDLLKSRLLRLSWTGKITAIYKDLGEVIGLATEDNDVVYTCSRDRNSVRYFSPDLSKSRIILDVNDGLSGPAALAYSSNMSRLYISYRKGSDECRNRIHVFKII